DHTSPTPSSESGGNAGRNIIGGAEESHDERYFPEGHGFLPGSAFIGSWWSGWLIENTGVFTGPPAVESDQQSSEPRKSEPTPEGIRMGKLVDCLESAKATYLQMTADARREYDALFLNPAAVGGIFWSAVTGRLNGLMGGLAGRAAF